MRSIILALALLFTGVGAADGLAQSKKSTEKKSESSPSTSGLQRCEGGLFFIQDGGMGPLCQRRDGKVCQIRGGTSGEAILTDCK